FLLLKTAISYGVEEKHEKNNSVELLNRDTGEMIPDNIVKLSEIFDDIKDENDFFPDSGLLLFDEDTSFVSLSATLLLYFKENILDRQECSDDAEWFNKLFQFFNYIVKRRVDRVNEWYQQNTEKFSPDNIDIKDGKYVLDQAINQLSLFWTLCGLSCQKCNLKCLKHRHHEEAHDCLTDHKCHAKCEFEESHPNRLFPQCHHRAGHDGKHACEAKLCIFSDKRNCQQKCALEIGHDNDKHLCQSKRHFCGAPCSLQVKLELTGKDNYFKCSNKCIVPCEDEHERHKCENDAVCPIQCPIPHCQRRCQSNDHFHAFEDNLCEEAGICKVSTEPKKQEETYQGLVAETSFTFTKYIQSCERYKCGKMIPAGAFKHEGKHSHGGNNFHYCDAKCPFCEYYCILPYGHPQPLHDTKHGNMIQTEFTAEETDFKYGDYNLKTGDQGTFVLCNLCCKEYGRHRHIDYCKDESSCTPNAHKQHIVGVVHPNPEKKKDFISHSLYWQYTGFKDPYSINEQEEFSKCDAECPDEIHQKVKGSNVAPIKSFCELQLFHPPINPSNVPPSGIGYVSLDGHHFTCENPSTREGLFHIIFVIDRSGSMSANDKKPLPNTPVYNQVRAHNNRAGAVYSAVYAFMEARIAAKSQQQATNKDKISLISI
ncbi:7364_t:CDS:10, partial [Dentiscutata heterogama]